MITATELDAELRAIRTLVRRIRPAGGAIADAFFLDKEAAAVRIGQLLGRLAELPMATVLVTAPREARPSGRELTRQAIAVATRRGTRTVEVERRRRV